MIEPIIKYIAEPNLTFGNNQKATDPRDGLMLFGPFDNKKIKGGITLGIIGPFAAREAMIAYLKKLHSPILPIKDPQKHPMFPGIESVMGISVNFENVQQINIEDKDIEEALKYSDSHIRINKLVNLYVGPLVLFGKEEEMPVNLWMVVIPEAIFTYGRPKSKIKNADDIIKTKISKEILNPLQQNLFPKYEEEEKMI